MKIESPAFQHNENLPSIYTCDGGGTTPPLIFGDVPEGAKSLVLFFDDPDAVTGTFDHWVVWNIPVTTIEIKEGETPQGVVGKNSSGQNNYFPPCPPSGQHRYTFTVYALDTLLDVPSLSSKEMVKKAMDGHILDSSTLIGLYCR